MHKSTLSASPV